MDLSAMGCCRECSGERFGEHSRSVDTQTPSGRSMQRSCSNVLFGLPEVLEHPLVDAFAGPVAGLGVEFDRQHLRPGSADRHLEGVAERL